MASGAEGWGGCGFKGLWGLSNGRPPLPAPLLCCFPPITRGLGCFQIRHLMDYWSTEDSVIGDLS